MAKKPILLGYDEHGRPMYGLPSQPSGPTGRNGHYDTRPDGSIAPGPAAARKGTYQTRPDGSIAPGDPIREPYRENAGLAGSRMDSPTGVLKPFSQQSSDASGNSDLLVDYSKDPYKTTVPGQPGYDQSKDPFHQTPEQQAKAAAEKAKADKLRKLYERSPSGEWWTKSRGEKDPSNCWGIHIDNWEAAKLKNEFESMRRMDEVLYPGSRGRQHSSGGTNLGEPEWSGSGGGAFYEGANEWRMASGAVVGEGGISLVQVLDSWNIYQGQ